MIPSQVAIGFVPFFCLFFLFGWLMSLNMIIMMVTGKSDNIKTDNSNHFIGSQSIDVGFQEKLLSQQLKDLLTPSDNNNSNNNNNKHSLQQQEQQHFGKWAVLLEKWNLEIFVNVFAEYGWTDLTDWNGITQDDMKDMGMKKGHIMRFNRLFKQYTDLTDVNQNVNTIAIYAIKSVSSGNYLTQEYSGSNVVLMTDKDPKFDQLVHFQLIETKLGFALKNVASDDSYLQNDDNYANRPWMHRQYESINDDLKVNFKFVQTNNGNFAIQSLLDGRYLDGRDNVEERTLLTNRDPTNDPYLQWKLIPIHLIDDDV